MKSRDLKSLLSNSNMCRSIIMLQVGSLGFQQPGTTLLNMMCRWLDQAILCLLLSPMPQRQMMHSSRLFSLSMTSWLRRMQEHTFHSDNSLQSLEELLQLSASFLVDLECFSWFNTFGGWEILTKGYLTGSWTLRLSSRSSPSLRLPLFKKRSYKSRSTMPLKKISKSLAILNLRISWPIFKASWKKPSFRARQI